MKKTSYSLALFLLLLFSFFTLTGCSSQQDARQSKQPQPKIAITVAAAASLQDAANELKDLYEEKHSDINITYNFASSGTLQKQIEEGAPADLFISAGKKQMDALQEQGLIVDSTRQDLLGNSLVLIAPKNSGLSNFEGLTDPAVNKISIGTPETVPAGKYAQETLGNLNLWDKIQAKLVLAKDVRQVLTYVETGNVDAGLVYNSDTVGAKEIKIVAQAPPESHKAIVYPMAIVKSSQQQQAAGNFASFLGSAEAAQVFAKYGFEPLNK